MGVLLLSTMKVGQIKAAADLLDSYLNIGNQ
jgi:hypothetical protein